MPNLIKDLGVAGFNERCTHALIEQDQSILRVEGAAADGRTVLCTVLASRPPRAGRNGGEVRVARDVFTTYDVFKTPQLGYRRVGENSVVYIRKRLERSHASGFRLDRLLVEASPMSALLMQMAGVPRPAIAGSARATAQLYWPAFDTAADWDAMLAGEKTALVLSSRWLVEPSVYGTAASYDVFCDGMCIGTVGADKQPLPETPKENIRLIREIFNS